MALDHVVTVRDVLDWIEVGSFVTAGVCGCVFLWLMYGWRR